ncbi:hypothetical protein [Burkholderia sp. TSV86]|nr:hypothetical protein [Burkholderia sp. TSV86]
MSSKINSSNQSNNVAGAPNLANHQSNQNLTSNRNKPNQAMQGMKTDVTQQIK